MITGHNMRDKFAYYISVRDDTQSLFIETSTRDSFIKLATNASLTKDVVVPQKLATTQIYTIKKDAKLVVFQRSCDSFSQSFGNLYARDSQKGLFP